DSFVILDEAQNTTPEQMKMFLTRIGYNSKAVITGDVTQIDLPFGKLSGLIEARNVISGVEGVCFIHFNERDVVRHPLVQRIVRAYEAYTTQNTARQQALQFGQTTTGNIAAWTSRQMCCHFLARTDTWAIFSYRRKLHIIRQANHRR